MIRLAGLILALLLSTVGVSEGAIAFVAGTCTQGNTTAAITTTGATLLVVGVTATSSNISISDSKGNTWARDSGPLTINDSTFVYSSAATSVGTAHTVTIGTGANAHNTICVAAFSGITSPLFDKSAFSIQNGVTLVSSSSTTQTTTADEVVIGYAQLSNNSAFVWTATNGATLVGSLGNGNTDSTGALSYRIVNAIGSYAATFSATAQGNAGAQVATYRAAGPPDTTPPSDPSSLATSAVTSESVHLVWQASTDDVAVDHYSIEVATGSCGGSFSVLGTSNASTTPSYDATGLTPSAVLCFRVQALDSASNASGYATSTTVTLLAAQTLFVRFTDTQADGTGAETGFKIYRKDVVGTSFSLLTTVAAHAGTGGVTYQDTSAPNPTSCYQVAATNTFGDSAALGGSSGECYTKPNTTTHGNRIRGWRR